MGWTGGFNDRAEAIAYELRNWNSIPNARVLKSKRSLNALWVLVESTKDGKREVWIGVSLLQGHRGNVCTKDITEHMGPHETDVPASWLDECTEPTNEFSAEWRGRVRAAAAEAERGRKLKREIAIGDIIELPTGYSPQAVRVIAVGRRTVGENVRGYGKYTIPPRVLRVAKIIHNPPPNYQLSLA